MRQVKLSDGTAHKLPDDIKKALILKPKASEAWESLTPLARNEWICWTITVKNPATRQAHVERVVRELIEGKRRPCCWLGCTHRTDKKLSPTQRYMLSRKNKRS